MNWFHSSISYKSLRSSFFFFTSRSISCFELSKVPSKLLNEEPDLRIGAKLGSCQATSEALVLKEDAHLEESEAPTGVL